MPRILIILAALMVTGGSAIPAGAVSYSLGNGLFDGIWFEIYSGGGPGQTGNEIAALSELDPDPDIPADSWFRLQWTIDSLFLESTLTLWSGPGGQSIQVTRYSGGILSLRDDISPWGELAVIEDVAALNYSYLNRSGGLNFLTVMTARQDNYEFRITAGFSADRAEFYAPDVPAGTAIMADFFPEYTELNLELILKADAHAGKGFSSLRLDIDAVPEPATFLLLLVGLAGAAGMVRRFVH